MSKEDENENELEDEEEKARELEEEEEERGQEWEEYKESMKELEDQYKETLRDWKERIRDWKQQMMERERNRVASGSVSIDLPSEPPVPPMPPMLSRHSVSRGRINVVASRIGDEDIRLIDMLIEAGVFGTRSEAVAYLVNEGIKARRDTFEKVSKSLEEIRKARKEAEKQTEKLREEIGLKESKESEENEEQSHNCPNCRKQIPEGNWAFCPFCGTSLKRTGK